MADVEMPQLGETVTEGTITQWFKAVGDEVAMDEVLFEVSTDKVDSEVPSPAAGFLAEILVAEGETVDVGTRLAVLTPEPPSGGTPTAGESAHQSEDPPPSAAAMPAEPVGEVEEQPVPDRQAPVTSEPVSAPEPPAAVDAPPADAPLLLSPLVRRLADEHGIDVATIQGTGVGGRVTRRDVEARVEANRAGGGSPVTASPPEPTHPTPPARVGGSRQPQVVPLSNIRRRTGEHMVRSQDTSPHALTAVEVDFEGVDRVRRDHREAFASAEGFSLTYLPFVARALVDALGDFPHLNATVGDGELIVHGEVNLAIAVDLDFEGLLAPVIHDADTKRLPALAREVHDLADRARSKRLSADDIAGGTFTITNPGRYGTLMQFPIINQPQVAILSTDGVSRKPVVVTDPEGGESIAIHSVGVLALAWDHRAFDGAYAAAFLDRLREILETRDWSAEL